MLLLTLSLPITVRVVQQLVAVDAESVCVGRLVAGPGQAVDVGRGRLAGPSQPGVMGRGRLVAPLPDDNFAGFAASSASFAP